MNFDSIIPTNGQGLWSDVAKNVRTTKIDVVYIDEEYDFGELRVYFDVTTWDTNEDGLIYTDPLFLSELKLLLNIENLDASDVSYSEQGMQGEDYVSFDIGPKFIKSWL